MSRTPEERKRVLWDSTLRDKTTEKTQKAALFAAERAAVLDPDYQHADTIRVPHLNLCFLSLFLFDVWVHTDIHAWHIQTNESQRPTPYPSTIKQEIWLGCNGRLYTARVGKRKTRKPKSLDPETLDRWNLKALHMQLSRDIKRLLNRS